MKGAMTGSRLSWPSHIYEIWLQKRFLRNCLENPVIIRNYTSEVVRELADLTTDFMYNLPQPYEMSSTVASIGSFRVSVNPLTIREYEYDFDLPTA